MKKILLDTNAYSELMRGNTDVLAILQHAEWVGLTATSLGELIGGFEFGSKYRENLEQLNKFLNKPTVISVSVDETTATFYAKVYAFLRKKGEPIPSNDIWIAASALQHGCKLCTFDAHFKTIDNLLVATNLTEFLL